MPKYRINVNTVYKNQNKRGGRTMVINIPKGSIGELKHGCLIFPELARRGHNPFLFWNDVWKDVEPVPEFEGQANGFTVFLVDDAIAVPDHMWDVVPDGGTVTKLHTRADEEN